MTSSLLARLSQLISSESPSRIVSMLCELLRRKPGRNRLELRSESMAVARRILGAVTIGEMIEMGMMVMVGVVTLVGDILVQAHRT
jgi:hypothetical protein